jgi:dihydroxy-acid dehydratase
LIELDVAAGKLDLLVDEAILAERRQANPLPNPGANRGWRRIFSDHVLQADQGCDLDVLLGNEGSIEPEIN